MPPVGQNAANLDSDGAEVLVGEAEDHEGTGVREVGEEEHDRGGGGENEAISATRRRRGVESATRRPRGCRA